MIVPIYKKGDKNKTTNYRVLKLLNTTYKVYVMIIEERPREKIDKDKILSDTQIGFRGREKY